MALYDSGSGGDIDQAVDRLELEVAQLSGEEQRRRARVAGGVAAVCLACFALMLFWPPGSPPEDLSLHRVGNPGSPAAGGRVPGLTCSNADVASGARPWADVPPPPGWTVVYATVLQRHWYAKNAAFDAKKMDFVLQTMDYVLKLMKFTGIAGCTAIPSLIITAGQVNSIAQQHPCRGSVDMALTLCGRASLLLMTRTRTHRLQQAQGQQGTASPNSSPCR